MRINAVYLLEKIEQLEAEPESNSSRSELILLLNFAENLDQSINWSIKTKFKMGSIPEAGIDVTSSPDSGLYIQLR